MSKYLHGLHEPGGEHLMSDRPGWIVFTERIFADPNDRGGRDYRQWSDAGFGVIVRLNHDYNPGGTIPQPHRYADFAQRCANFVDASLGAYIWIIGNEPNLSVERPQGEPITPEMYVECFNLCSAAILSVQQAAVICPAAIGPWNTETGDWLEYYSYVINNAQNIGGIALHTYTHGTDPELITSEQTMDAPFEDRRYHFRAYEDFMFLIPEKLFSLPVYITEANQNEQWQATGWVQAAYREIDEWNQAYEDEKIIHCLCLYRWPKYDQYHIDGKPDVQAGFVDVVARGYIVPENGNGGQPEMPENIIKNPTFLPPYYEDGAPERKVANEWRTWYDQAKRRWEWRQSAPNWENTQQWFETTALGDGGVRQRVNVGNDAIGKYFHVVAEVALESLNTGSGIGEYYASIGVDRIGEEDYRRQTVTWTTPLHQDFMPKWTQIELVVPIENDWVTVYLRAWNKYAVSGSMFVESCYGYVIDDPCGDGGTDPEPPDPEPQPPVDCGIKNYHAARAEEIAIARRYLGSISAALQDMLDEIETMHRELAEEL